MTRLSAISRQRRRFFKKLAQCRFDVDWPMIAGHPSSKPDQTCPRSRMPNYSSDDHAYIGPEASAGLSEGSSTR